MTQPIQSVYVANGQIEANIIKGMLEAAGIPAEISQEGAGEIYGITIGLMGEVHVLVAADRAAEAAALLSTMEQEAPAEAETPADAPPAEETE